jgi:AcrR family transcriptional regulator
VKRVRRALGRPQGGSEEIVRAILEATLAEIEAHGFADLRVEDVARAAGVNKTSVYRRWPTKGELVLAALATTSSDEPELVESGDLRRDLIAMLTAKTAQISTPRGRKIMRALMAFDDGVESLTAALREHRYTKARALLANAVARGALPRDSDPGFLSELLMAPVLHRILIVNEPVGAAFLARVVDHVLEGARAPSTEREAPSAEHGGPSDAGGAPRPKRRVRSKQL